MNERPKVGLALGAGAARGYAHIGVLEVLEGAGIPIDYVSGSSMGAVIGSVYACGYTPQELEAWALGIRMEDQLAMMDVTLPTMGLIKGDRIERMLRETYYGQRVTFEDLDVPFAVVACCLEEGRVQTFSQGPFVAPVRASMSIPGVFVPVTLDGRTYVDAGALERVPVEAVRSLGAQLTIGVDVGFRGGPAPKPDNIFEVVSQYFDLVEWSSVSCDTVMVDVLITVDTMELKSSQFYKAQPFIEAGRAAAQAALPQIQQALMLYGMEQQAPKSLRAWRCAACGQESGQLV